MHWLWTFLTQIFENTSDKFQVAIHTQHQPTVYVSTVFTLYCFTIMYIFYELYGLCEKYHLIEDDENEIKYVEESEEEIVEQQRQPVVEQEMVRIIYALRNRNIYSGQLSTSLPKQNLPKNINVVHNLRSRVIYSA